MTKAVKKLIGLICSLYDTVDEEKTAAELFADAGWVQYNKQIGKAVDLISYNYKNEGKRHIYFDKIHKKIEVSSVKESYQTVSLSPAECKAIAKQVEELGWN